MRIRVPVEILNEAASNLSKTEATIVQNNNSLIKIWNGLRLEAKSKNSVEQKVRQAQGLAGRLSTETVALSKYVNIVNGRFIEVDRREFKLASTMGKKTIGIADGWGKAVYNSMNQDKELIIALAVMGPVGAAAVLLSPISKNGLMWVGEQIDKRGCEVYMPGETCAARNLAYNRIEGADFDTTVGDLAVDVAKIVALPGAIAIGKGVAGIAVVAALPIVAKVAVVVGIGAVGYLTLNYISDRVFNYKIKEKSVDRWLKDGTAYHLKIIRENPGLVIAAGPVASSIISLNYISKETVGLDVIAGVGNMVNGLKNKIFSR